jgi:hypothetical protein
MCACVCVRLSEFNDLVCACKYFSICLSVCLTVRVCVGDAREVYACLCQYLLSHLLRLIKTLRPFLFASINAHRRQRFQ